jgi:uncharacterized protein
MERSLTERKGQLATLCTKHKVRRLALFGSAATGGFDPTTSDLDFLVEFEQMPPTAHADNYFGLMEDLKLLFQRDIELVELAPIENPYFREAVQETEVVLYEAA